MSNHLEIDFSAIKSMTELLDILRKNNIPKNIYWRYVEKYQERKAREKGIPLYGQFELTPFCNLDCKMCYVHLDPKQVNREALLPAAWWKNIMQQAHFLGMTHASLTGGECLSYSQFDDIYMYLRSLGVNTSIKTNGILLDQKRTDFFHKYPPRGITVSLYGSCNDAYEKVTGHPVFDIVYENLQRIKDAGLNVDIAVTPSKYMYDDIPNIIETIKKIDLPYSVNIMLFPPREETGREVCDLSNQEYIEIYKYLQARKYRNTETKEETEANKHDDIHVGLRCGAGRSTFNIEWNGTMAACENLGFPRISLLDHSFSDAWKYIHEKVASYLLPIECTDCKFKSICFNCVAYRCIGMDRGHCNPRICERTKLLVREGIYSL